MPTLTAETGVFLLNGPVTGLLYSPRLPIAADICKGSNICQSDPVEIDCSLACTPVGWPMQGGALFIELFSSSPDCPNESTVTPSIYCTGVYVSLGCQPHDPVIDSGIWQGEAIADCTALISSGVSYGLTLQVCVRMTVNLNKSLTFNVEIKRIVPASDIHPPPADGLNQIASCLSFSKTLTRDDPTKEINIEREYRYPGGLDPFTGLPKPNEIFAVTPSTSLLCPLDVKSVRLTGYLFPYTVGCNGTAEAGPSGSCSLNTGFKTYSCFAALIRPTTVGDFPPHWVQLGINTLANAGPYMCLLGNSGSTGTSPIQPPSIYPIPPIGYNYPAASDVVTIGCPGEDPVNGDSQQIQFATVGDYDVVLKCINKGNICAAMRLTGAGNPWTIGTATAFNSTIYNQTGHYIKTFTFAGLSGNPIATFYGLEFPWGIISQCVEDNNPITMTPPITSDQPQLIVEVKERQSKIHQTVIETLKKMDEVRQNPCVYLGKSLETVASCGCAGGILHECKKHGTCRVSGNTKELNCWRCPDYQKRGNNGSIQ